MTAPPGPGNAEAPEPVESRAHRESFWQGQIGMRSTFVTDKGFDPFASDNALTTFSLGFTRTVFHREAFSFAPGVVWDYGARSAAARGQPTSLSAHRLGLALEGRYHFAPWAYGLLRVTPSAIQQTAKLEDGLVPAPYVASAWSFAVDASAGAAFLLGPHGSGPAPVRWWLAGEGGYGFASSASLRMRPELADDDPRRIGDLDFGKVALGGAFIRAYGAITF
ncbi:MAG: hypothetical protein ABW133_01240 [Polyangiaceae bacterium]